MSVRNALAISLVALAAAGCTTVEVKYRERQAFNDPKVAEDAKAGMSFYALQRVVVEVAPKPAEKPKQTTSSSGDQASTTQSSGAQSSGAQSPGAQSSGGSGSRPAETHEEAAPVGGKSGTRVAGQGGGGGSAAQASSSGGNTTSPAGSSTTDGNTQAGTAGKSNTTSTVDKKTETAKSDTLGSGQPDAPAATVIIGDQEIQVTLRIIPDPNYGVMMGGKSGFWKKTAVTGAKYPNSDRIGSVNVKAESLVVKRIGQFAAVAGYFINPGKGDLTESAPAPGSKPPPLTPFSVEVNPKTNGVTKEEGAWSYTLTLETEPKGAVSWTTFQRLHGDKAVNYFPVPACLTATLKLSAQNGQYAYAFPLVVSMPEVVRLEPLPIDGKLTLSPVCGSTVEGAAEVDHYDEGFAAADALNKAYTALSKKPEEGAAKDAGAKTDATKTDAGDAKSQ